MSLKPGFSPSPSSPDDPLMQAYLAAIRQSSQVSQEMMAMLAAELEEGFAPASLSERELFCARAFNFALPEDPVSAVEMLEAAVLDLTGALRCELFSFDEESGVFTSLSDEKKLGAKPRELTTIGDDYLSAWMGAVESEGEAFGTIQHTHLLAGSALVGLVVVQHPMDPDALEALSPYLAVKVQEFKALKKTLLLPHKQEVLIDLSTRLVSAVDKESILTETLDLVWARMGFGVCQYVVLDEAPPYETSLNGTVLYENIDGQLKSFFHAGLAGKRHVVQDFAAIISLLSSGWRKQSYLHLKSDHLGDKPLSAIFGVDQVYSAMILPVIDMTTGKIQGTLNFFQTQPIEISPQTVELLLMISGLVSNAMGRATVLEKAMELATQDELTGLLNRRGFYERFAAEVDRARRHPAELCVALIDVDHFKRLNDTYGHLNGDVVLKTLGQLLSGSVRKTDVVCRFGGEEFAILLPDTPMSAAVDLVERLRKKVEEADITGIQGEALKTTVSIGVAPVDLEFEPIEVDANHRELISAALSEADALLYDAKEAGRNCVIQAD